MNLFLTFKIYLFLQNVLLQKIANGSLKAVVADFGLSCKIPQAVEKLTQVGTPFWMAPECLKEDFYDEKVHFIVWCLQIKRRKYSLCSSFMSQILYGGFNFKMRFKSSKRYLGRCFLLWNNTMPDDS